MLEFHELLFDFSLKKLVTDVRQFLDPHFPTFFIIKKNWETKSHIVLRNTCD